MRATWLAGSAFAAALLLTGLEACKGGSGDKKVEPTAGSAAGSATPSSDAASTATGGSAASSTCVPRNDDVYVTFDKQLLICAVEAKRCFSIDPDTGATAPAPHHDAQPTKKLAAATVETRDGKLQACVRDRCRAIGAKARADVETIDAAERGDVAATVDLVALVVPLEGEWHIWDIAKDRRIELTPPTSDQGLGLVWPTGNELYVGWSPPDERVYSSTGKEVASLYNEGSQLVALDDTHWAALTGDRILQIFGEPRHRIDLVESLGYADWSESLGLTVIGGGNLAVALVRPSEAVVALIDPRRGTVYKRWPLALCP